MKESAVGPTYLIELEESGVTFSFPGRFSYFDSSGCIWRLGSWCNQRTGRDKSRSYRGRSCACAQFRPVTRSSWKYLSGKFMTLPGVCITYRLERQLPTSNRPARGSRCKWCELMIHLKLKLSLLVGYFRAASVLQSIWYLDNLVWKCWRCAYRNIRHPCSYSATETSAGDARGSLGRGGSRRRRRLGRGRGRGRRSLSCWGRLCGSPNSTGTARVASKSTFYGHIKATILVSLRCIPVKLCEP